MKHRRRMRALLGVSTFAVLGAAALAGCGKLSPTPEPENAASQSAAITTWNTDFFDDFLGSSLDPNGWQDQILWVNGELQCYDNGYNEGGSHKTVEVSNGALKLRVVNTGTTSTCANWDKYGNQHGPTQYRAGRIASKNRKEFAQGKWTARILFYSWTWGNSFGQPSGLSGMFPAWWVLGSQNNEAPVQEPDENVCWPLTGSGEIDILEHHYASGQNNFTGRGVKSLGSCNNGDWATYQVGMTADLSQYHEFQMENTGSDLVYRIDNNEVGRNWGIGGNYPETMFAILNYALLAGMDGNSKEYVMQVDWVKHESSVNSRSISARLQAEGNDFLYHQSTSGTYENCAATSGACDVQDLGWSSTNDSVAWLVNVPSTTAYALTTNNAVNSTSGSSLAVYAGSSLPSSGQSCSAHGMTQVATMSLPNTGGWQAWQNNTSPTFNLTAGTQALCVQFTGGNQNLDWVSLNTAVVPRSISAHLQAENSDALFHQNGTGGPYENCAASSGTCEVQDLGWISTNDAVAWLVNVPNTAAYTLTTNDAVNSTSGTSLAVYTGTSVPASGQNCSAHGMTQVATMSLPNSAGWQAWQNNTSASFNLNSGPRAICVQFTAGNQNLDWVNLALASVADTTAPTVPTGLASSNPTNTTITLSWSASTDPDSAVAHYNVYRNGTKVGTPSSASFTDVSLFASTSYNYTVSAVDPTGNTSAQSGVLAASTAADTTAPSVPTGLVKTSVTSSSITLGWNASTDSDSLVAGYNIYRGGTEIPVGTLTSTSFTDTGLAANTSYSYTVSAVDPTGNVSAQSSALSAATAAVADTTPPSVPTGLAKGTVTTSS
ncbi:MAG TPA: carbohydrate-binding protein, partial [Polyangiaceae bacterium]|nr:carbohydrate-binding protein [Polyangiaceae bacterium]